MMFASCRVKFIVVLFLLMVIWQPHSLSLGQETLKPGRLPSEVRKQLISGVMLAYSSSDGKSFEHARLPALYLEETDLPNPWISGSSPFKAVFSGYIKLKLKGSFEFSLAGRGKVSLLMNDQLVLEKSGKLEASQGVKCQLVKGYNRFRLVYTPPPQGIRQLRVYWKGEDFKREPVPPTAFWVQQNQPELERGMLATHGHYLTMQRQCLQCHATQSPLDPFLESQDAPDLRTAVHRLEKDWLAKWIAKPSSLRNNVSMPHLLETDDAGGQAAADLVAYLGTLQPSDDDPVVHSVGNIERGGNAFENLGCIGCHRWTPPEEEDEYDRISLFYVNAKFQKGRLAEFLLDSRKHYRWSKMPQFELSNEQSRDLASFLRDVGKGEIEETQEYVGDSLKGSEYFQKTGCAQCHSVEQKENRSEFSAPFAEVKQGRGCLSETPPAGVPRFGFSDLERTALNTFVGVQPEFPFKKLNDSQYSFQALTALRCVTCHDLDQEQAELPYIIEEEGVVGLPPNRVPMLTHAGEKLNTHWSKQLLAGRLGYRVREHFRVPMPGFPARGATIAKGLSRQHGFADQEESSASQDAEKIKIGRRAVEMETGLSCNRCHAIADRKPNAAFDAQSTNLIYAANRLRKEYYLRWMFDPLRIDKQTKMPKFSEDGKSTSLKTVSDGNADLQFNAIWQYLQSIKSSQK